ncbi:MAG: hypothetical protein A2Y21_02565, partial [Clostridiales bacterium GWC2_40_7]
MILKIFKGYERFEDHYPTEAVKYALANKEEAIPELLEILEHTLCDVENLSKEERYLVHFPAIYILAYFRETRSYKSIIKIASLPDDQIFCLLGDAVTDDFKNILASVCDGNIEPIKRIIENSSLDEYVRTEALESLLILLNHGVVSREQLVFYFKELFNGKLEVDYSCVWDTLPRCCSLIHPAGLKGDIEKAVADGKVMEIIADLNLMNRQLKRSVKEVLDELKEDEDYSFISEEDVYSLEEWVGRISCNEEDGDEYPFEDYKIEYEEMWGSVDEYEDEYEYDDTEEWETEAEFFDQEDWEGLVEYRRRKAEKYPDEPDCQWSLGEAYVLNKEYEKAINFLDGLHKKYPDDPNIQHSLLDALFAIGKDETAVKWIIRPNILRLDKDTLDYCYNFLQTKRKPRTVHELHLQLYSEGYPAFDDHQLMNFLLSDNRFTVTG